MTCESHSQFLGKSCPCNFSPDRVIERMGVKQWLLSYVKKLAWVHKKLKVDWQTNLQILPIRGNHPHITPWMAHILLVIADVIIDNFIFHLLQMEFWIFNLAVSYLRLTLVGFPCGSVIRNLPAKQETWVPSLSWEDPLQKEMATYSSILTRTEEPGRQQSMWSHKSWVWLSDQTVTTTNIILQSRF